MENVYFIKCKQYVKIGHASDVSKRLSELQIGCPFPLKLMAVIPGDRRLERAFHEALHAWRVRGEWFDARTGAPVRKLMVLINNGARPTKLSEIIVLRDFSPRNGFGRGLGAPEVASFAGLTVESEQG